MTEHCLSFHIMGRRRHSRWHDCGKHFAQPLKKKKSLGAILSLLFDLIRAHHRIVTNGYQGTGHHVARGTVKQQIALTLVQTEISEDYMLWTFCFSVANSMCWTVWIVQTVYNWYDWYILQICKNSIYNPIIYLHMSKYMSFVMYLKILKEIGKEWSDWFSLFMVPHWFIDCWNSKGNTHRLI